MREPAWLGSRSLPVAIVLLGAVCSSAALAGLQPHRAAYRLALDEAHGLESLESVQGALVIEWRRVCDGWLSRQRLGFVAASQEGGGFNHDVRFSSWEAADGSALSYAVRSFEDEELLEAYRGGASINGASGGVASFREPERRDVTLPAGTVFPGAHLGAILAAALNGERLITHQVFDGWGFDALTQVTTAIGEPRRLEASGAGAAANRRVWPVSMAYYNLEAGQDMPEFEAAFLLEEQGVLRDLTLDYGDFALIATLEDLELLEPPDC